ncbi:MAG: acyl-CoA dehydrogenase [Candidatus Sericytochromatia bacterium]
MFLLNPKNNNYDYLDQKSKDIMLKTIEFFETKGKNKLTEDNMNYVWNYDFVEFVKKEKIFSTLMTPKGYGATDSSWNTSRICAFNEILGFYGLPYWYTWQVSMLGLCPVWMSNNEKIKNKTAQLLEDGGVFAFGLSEKEHGADLYSSEMKLEPVKEDDYKANGRKYYIGNGNEASLVSVFGKIANTDEFVFFPVDSKNENFTCIQNVIASQLYVSEFELKDYPIKEADILSKGELAWDTALNTVNVCKFNLGWAAIGMCTHSFYETINHAGNRRLFNHYVTDFPHIKQLFTDSYTRLIAMKLFCSRAADYMRSASEEDKRYLLFNSIVKMKVTSQGEEVLNLLADIIAAKGFEKNTYFSMAIRDIRGLPKLEGTVHVNMALIIKFMANYFFFPASFPEIGKRDDNENDSFLFNQGKTKGLSKIKFHDYNIAYNSVDLPNINIFKEQIAIFKNLLFMARPSEEQAKNFDFLLSLGEIFTLVVYGQLIIESAKLNNISDDILDQIFDFMVRDFSKFALQIYSKTSSTEKQMELCLKMLKKSAINIERTNKIWEQDILTLKDLYNMNN